MKSLLSLLVLAGGLSAAEIVVSGAAKPMEHIVLRTPLKGKGFIVLKDSDKVLKENVVGQFTTNGELVFQLLTAGPKHRRGRPTVARDRIEVPLDVTAGEHAP